VKKILIFSIIASLILSIIGFVFWQQELQYAMPTTKPISFKEVKLGEIVDLGNFIQQPKKDNLVLHFYNPDCPCSRFNMKDFEQMAKAFEDQAQFYVIVQSDEEDAVAKFIDKYEMDIPVMLDRDGAISDLCGIYSTPQAVILNKDSKIFFKGNYNKTRYCTRKETKFAEIALTHLIKNEPLPTFLILELTEPFGCSLPSDEHDKTLSWNIF
jgi:AhpC/TSA family